MATTDYETVLKQARQLAPEEQHRLVGALQEAHESPLVRFLRSMGPLDPAIADEMERAIEEDCERVDTGNW